LEEQLVAQARELREMGHGASWYAVDLHFHTPGSHDAYNEREYTAAEICQAARDAGLSMIAITDHHTGEWCDLMKEAGREIGLVVLPGVEVSVEGVHLTGVFPESASASDIAYLLHQLKIRDEDFGKKETICDVELTIPEVLTQIKQAGGIPIAAHSDSKGLTDSTHGQWRIGLVQHPSLRIVEITHCATARFFDGTDPNYQRKLTCIRSSDSHALDEIGRRRTWVKMGQPSFASLKQIILEPELRVRRTVPGTVAHTHLVGIGVSGGLYGGECVPFSPSLNCIIGGRGAGKSAIVDLLRFVIDAEPRDATSRSVYYSRIADLLGIGNNVALHFQKDGSTYAAVRTLVDVTRARRTEGAPTALQSEYRAFRLLADSAIEVSEPIEQLLEVEVFGQNEVFELTKRADDQLALIDEYVGVDGLKTQEAETVGALRSNADELLEVEREVESADAELAELPEFEREVNELTRQLDNPLFETRAGWEAEAALLGELVDSVDQIESAIQSCRKALPCSGFPSLADTMPNHLDLAHATATAQDLARSVTRVLSALLEEVNASRDRLEPLASGWRAARATYDVQFAQELAKANATDLKLLADRRDKLSAEVARLARTVKPLRDAQLARSAQLRTVRARLLMELCMVRAAITDKRRERVNAMSARLADSDVRVELRPVDDLNPYVSSLEELFSGSGVKSQSEQARLIAEKACPMEFAADLRCGRPDLLVQRYGITPNTADRLVELASREVLMELQVCTVPDRPEISLRKPGDEEFSPLEHLSYGEKCTAVFSMALLGVHKPLVVDQPEDELDHAFIIDNVVAHVREVKEGRQLVFATHNANIPVLGDAEQVLCVEKLPGRDRCAVRALGAFETPPIVEALQQLEGGPDAFRRRREKYGLAE